MTVEEMTVSKVSRPIGQHTTRRNIPDTWDLVVSAIIANAKKHYYENNSALEF